MTDAEPKTAAPVAPGRFWNVPNTLTLSRLVFGAIAFALLALDDYVGSLVAFGIATLTDALDGYFARLLNQSSALGRQLDPLVDKIVVIALMVELVSRPGTGLAPWMVALIVVRELTIQAIRSLIEGKGEPFGAKFLGKLKTTFQTASILGIIFCLALDPAPRSLQVARDIVTWTAVALTVYSGLTYVVAASPHLSREAATR